MKHTRRWLAILLALVLTLGVMPMAMADEPADTTAPTDTTAPADPEKKDEGTTPADPEKKDEETTPAAPKFTDVAATSPYCRRH